MCFFSSFLSLPHQQQEKRRELRLKKFWRTTTKPPTSSEDSGGCESPTKLGRKAFQQPHQNSINSPARNPPTCSLPLLQVWPSQDSPRGEADGQSFVFPLAPDDTHLGGLHHTSSLYHPAIASGSGSGDLRRNSLFVDQLQAGDSGIDSVQASPSPVAMPCHPMVVSNAISPSASPTVGSPTPSVDRNNRRPSTSLLHPDHARLFALRQPTSPDQVRTTLGYVKSCFFILSLLYLVVITRRQYGIQRCRGEPRPVHGQFQHDLVPDVGGGGHPGTSSTKVNIF